MRIATGILAFAALAACIPEEREEPGQDACGASRLQERVGTQVGQHDFGPGTRIIPPGTAVTMDHRPDRLNVETDADGVITRVYCG